MTDLMRYAAELEASSGRKLPPVEKWNPEYCGEIDLVIRADGTWVHEGTPIGRARLVRLFSTVLKRESGGHYLVTPVEKLGIRVEDAAFVAVLMRREGEGRDQRLIFTTNVGDETAAGEGHAIAYRETPGGEGKAPYLHIRAGLEARIARAVYYDLVELGETRETDGVETFGVWSGGVFFPFGRAEDILNV